MKFVRLSYTVFQGFRSLGTNRDDKNFFWLMVLLPLSVIFDSVNVALVIPLSEVIFNSALAPSNFESWVTKVSLKTSIEPNQFVVILFGVSSVFGAVLKVVFFKVQFKWVSELTGSISAIALKHYIKQNYVRYIARRNSSLADILTHKIYHMSSHLLSPITLLIQGVISTFVILLILLQTNFFVSVICISSLTILYFSLIVVMKGKLKRVSDDLRVCSSQSIFIGNSIETGFRDIKVFGLGSFIFNLFVINEKKFRSAQADNLFIAHSPRYFVEIGIFFVGSILIFVAILDNNLQRLLPTLALFSFAILRLMPFMQQIFTSIAMVAAGHGIVMELAKEFDFDTKERDLPLEPSRYQNLSNPRAISNVSLEKVKFKYPDGPDVGPVSCGVAKGKILLFLGESGKGKSTCLDMIAGLVEPSSGEIKLHGPLGKLEKPVLGRCLLLSQQPVLLQGSVRDNITLYDTVKPFDEQLFLDVVKDFRIDFIGDKFEISADENQTQRGFSGGQLQRLCLARIFYCAHDGQPLLLDEPTSALDHNNEDLILDAIQKQKKNRIIIISSHSKKLLSISDEQFEF